MTKTKKSFWWGLSAGIFVSFVASYLAWPQIPLDTEFRDGVKVILPDEQNKTQITYPLDGAKISGRFLVYGTGVKGYDSGVVALVDSRDQVITQRNVEFAKGSAQENGTFIAVFDLGDREVEDEAGFVKLFVGEERREVAKNHVRFR